MSGAHSPKDAVVLRPLALPQEQTTLVAQLRVLYPSIDEVTLLGHLANVRQLGWECIVAVAQGGEAGAVVGLSGYWIHVRLCYGKYLYVDHFIVAGGERRRGVGRIMWRELERIAHEHGCERIVLDTFVTNSVAQRFWMNQGCGIVGFHFGKQLRGE
ncbi:MAG: GNAT family N-acetyltransferase [Alphaproteobacteria bacterium]|nr:GNAT family N-acetyltransferase [Alphaproteobacteria bacterium]